ncbi:C6 transcription factor, putative [Aspergillus fumigatus Z5]|nr:C6 transcription factor, putative [Aspergillus fumigatus Z5]
MAESKPFPAPPGGSGTNEAQQKRKNVGTACSACKTRKLKNNVECTFDASADKRRRGALKRKVNQLEEKEELLIQLVSTLRESGTRRTIQLLNLIRSNASLSEIQLYIDTQLKSELEQTPELIEVCNEIQRFEPMGSRSWRRILDAQRAFVEPLFRVPAAPWTTVTADDEFVSHLISLWFTWVHPFYYWIDRELFLRDMQSGSLDSKFCSPFLVNAILADACAYSDSLESDAQGARFYNEAKRLLDKEEGRITLATAQGLGVLWICASMTRKDRHGWIHQSQLAYAVQELFPSITPPKDVDGEALDLVRAANVTIWGLSNIAMTHAVSSRKASLIKPPRKIRLPPITHDPDTDLWVPYPTESEKLQAHTLCTFRALCSLNEIAYDITYPHFHGEVSSSETEKTDELQRRLREWQSELPPCLKKRDAIEVPHNGQSDHRLFHMMPKSHQEACLSSARSISQLMRLHRSAWGVERMPQGTSQPINIALLVLLERLDVPENRDAFINLSIAAKAASRRWSSSKAALDRVRTRAIIHGLHLPTETDSLFADFGKRPENEPSDEFPFPMADTIEISDGEGSDM